MKDVFTLLQIFADEGEAATQADTSSDAGFVEATAEGSQPATDTAEGQPATDEGQESFDELISGKFKEDYNKRVQKAVKERIKNIKSSEDKLKSLTTAHKLLARHYGVDENDVKALASAVENDDKLYEKIALEKGIDASSAKELVTTELENEELREFKAQKMEQERIQSDIRKWKDEADQIKEIYPALDLGEEIKNPDFVSLLRNGQSVKTAYEVIHINDIMAGFGQHVAQSIEQKVVNKVKSGQMRPQENGISSPNGTVTKTSVDNLSDKQILELIKKIERGEQVKLE